MLRSMSYWQLCYGNNKRAWKSFHCTSIVTGVSFCQLVDFVTTIIASSASSLGCKSHWEIVPSGEGVSSSGCYCSAVSSGSYFAAYRYCYMTDPLVQYTVRPRKHNLCYNVPDLHIRFTSFFTFSVQPFRPQIFGATRAVFSLHVNCEKVFSLSDKMDAHAVEQCHPISSLNVKPFVPEFKAWEFKRPSLLCMLWMMALGYFGLLNCTLHVGCSQHSVQNG